MSFTIKDVAKKAGVSITAVSLVLNDKPNNISYETKEKILKVSRELNYRPNKLAKSLITKKTNIIGLVIPDMSNMFFAQMARDISMATKKYGYTQIIGETTYDESSNSQLVQLFTDYSVDGVILIKSTRYSKDLEFKNINFLKTHKIPFVILDSKHNNKCVNSVQVDHQLGGYIATKHLLDLGHRIIGCFSGPKGVTTSEERISGYRFALKEYGINQSFIFEGNYGFGLENVALEYFLKNKCTSIFALNDMMAISLYRAAFERKMNIPDDLSIVGFDNINFDEAIYPRLTTINQSIDKIANEAVEMLIEAIYNNKNGMTKIIKPNLVIRESTKRI